jgi:PE family
MSFVTAAPEQVQAAAQDLAGIRSSLLEASASVAVPTTGVVPAAADEVSAGVAAMFSNFGQEFQALSAQAQAFHEQFVDLLNAGAGAYMSTEAANVEQNLLNVASVDSALGGATQSVGGAVTALQTDSAVLQLSGQIAAGEQNLSGAIASATGNLATIAGPYQTLFANTAANLQAFQTVLSANPAPFLHQFVNNQIGYAQTFAAGLQNAILNLPAELANLPTNIQTGVQTLLAFNPAPLAQQFIANQMAYANIIATSLQNAANDFGAGVVALPAAFQTAFQALMVGNISGAINDIGKGFVNLFFTGFNVVPTEIQFSSDVSLSGTLGDLVPILTIPGQMAQNFTNLLPAGSIPAQISQNYTNVVNALTDIGANSTLDLETGNFTNTLGLPVALALQAAGAPINTLAAASSSATAFDNAVQAGNPTAAFDALVDAPAVVANGYLNGESVIPFTVTVNNAFIGTVPIQFNVPFDGILVPQNTYTAIVTFPMNPPMTLPVDGTELGGLLPALYGASGQLAAAITPT